MKRIVRRARKKGYASLLVWFPILTLVGSVVLLSFHDLPSRAEGPANGAANGAADDPQTAEAPRAALPAWGEETRLRAPVAFLPMVVGLGGGDLDSPFGVHANFLSPIVVDEVTQLGASWVRVPLYWSQIEPQNTTPEHYRWNAHVDYAAALLAARNIHIIFRLWENPAWAATYPMGPIDKVDLSELTEFMQAAVARYGTPPYNVRHWEIYNEPDNVDANYAATGDVGLFGDQPEVYVQTLAAIYGPMKEVDPQAQILLGGLAYDRWTSEGSNGDFAEHFLDGVLQHGGGAYFDVMNFHYYKYYRKKWDPYGPGLTGKANALRQKLAVHGVEKPFICTETSLWSDAKHGSNRELQARQVPMAFARTMAGGLQATTWYRLFDSVQASARQFGLLDVNVNPKPSYYAFQTLCQQLAATDYVRALPPVETGSDQIEAYEFLTKDGSTRVVVAWTDDELDHPLSLPVAQAIRLDKFGAETVLRDGDDSSVDGRVTTTVGPSPVYLRFPR